MILPLLSSRLPGGPVPIHFQSDKLTLCIKVAVDHVLPSSSEYVSQTSLLFLVCGIKILPVALICTGAAFPITVWGKFGPLSLRIKRNLDHVMPKSWDDFTTKSVHAKSEHECFLASAIANSVLFNVCIRTGIFIHA